MKTEMKMMDNGNYEEIISPIQHQCHIHHGEVQCVEYGHDLGKLYLTIDKDNDDEGYCDITLEIKHCPFCGYQPTK